MTEVVNTWDMFKEDRLKLNEDCDCVVRAIAVAYDTTYNKAHFYCRKYLNRQNRTGVLTSKEFDGKDRISYNTIPMMFKSRISHWFDRSDVVDQSDHKDNVRSGMYVAKFIKNFPQGTYIVLSRGHAFTIKDGVVYGNKNDTRKYIQIAYKLCRKKY